jgi:Ca2+-binding EF-hand superfamily protein
MSRYASTEMEFSDCQVIFFKKTSGQSNNSQFLYGMSNVDSIDHELRTFIDAIFEIYDEGHKDYLTQIEFQRLLIENISDNLSEENFQNLYKLADLNNDSHVDKEELFILYKILLKL